MKKYIYGIDIGGTSVKLGLFKADGKLITKWQIKTDKTDHGVNVVNDIYHSIKKHTPNLKEIIGYGFGVPGPTIDNLVHVCVNLGWKDYDLKEEFRNLVHNDNIFVENDANTAALGEAVYGAGRNCLDSVLLTIGTGIGGGVIVNNRVISGAFGAAGEIAHLSVNPPKAFQCNCGKKGCLETVASATGIKNSYIYLSELYKEKSSLDTMIKPSAKAIITAAENGDELALQVFDYFTRYLGYACHVISLATNPEVIVLGGGVSRAGDFLIEYVQKHFDTFVFEPVKNTKIVIAELGNDAGIFGGAQLVIQND